MLSAAANASGSPPAPSYPVRKLPYNTDPLITWNCLIFQSPDTFLVCWVPSILKHHSALPRVDLSCCSNFTKLPMTFMQELTLNPRPPPTSCPTKPGWMGAQNKFKLDLEKHKKCLTFCLICLVISSLRKFKTESFVLFLRGEEENRL